jgi:nucleotide-binding universal stress UspA family protein
VLTLLIPVDGSPGSDHAVELVIKLYRQLMPIDIRLLHVLPPDDGVRLDSARGQGAPAATPDDGDRALSSARALLDREKIPYASEVRSGFVPSTIVHHGRAVGCHGIVMGTRGMGTTDALLGSIVRQVIHLADVPVTLVK